MKIFENGKFREATLDDTIYKLLKKAESDMKEVSNKESE